MGWKDLDEKEKSTLSGRFVKLKDGETVKFRVLDEEPHTTFVHKVAQGDTFRTIPATANLDDDYIQQTNGKRFPAVAQYNLRVFEYGKDDKGKFIADSGEIKILQGGPAIFRTLREIYDQNGSLTAFDVTIATKGKKRDTEYTVSAAPVSLPVDVEALTTKMMQDQAIQWENVFAPITADQQKQILAEAKLDITFDPVAQIASSMNIEQAKMAVIGFGKYKGKTVGDIMVMDAGYLEWAGENVTSNDTVAAACRVAFNHVNNLTEGVAPAALPESTSNQAAPTPAAPTKSAAKAAPAQKSAPKPDAARQALIAEITGKLEDFDAPTIIKTVKKYSGGSSKLKDLTDEQLTALNNDLSA